MTAAMPVEAERALGSIGDADLVVGIPSFNNGRTIGRVAAAVSAGLAKYFPQLRAVVVNSDGGSTDNTREAMLSANMQDTSLLLLETPLTATHLLSFPYHGVPGKGSAFRMVFEMARRLGAKACAVVDSDLRSITPEWVDLLIRPVLSGGFDFVAPNYHRHKYDGTITNSIVYPLTRALYGYRVRQPIGGEFGISSRLIDRYLRHTDWDSDIARFGIDIWLTTVALAEDYRVCQCYLGAKLHDAKDPASDLSSMLEQVVGSVFQLMIEYDRRWQGVHGSKAVDTFGFRFDVGLDPVEVNVAKMVALFQRAARDLDEIWRMVLSPETHAAVRELAAGAGSSAFFHLPDGLWVQIVFDFALCYRNPPVTRGVLLRSLTPLYIARVASFVAETERMTAAEADERVERLCRAFEEGKPLLTAAWLSTDRSAPDVSRGEEVAHV